MEPAKKTSNLDKMFVVSCAGLLVSFGLCGLSSNSGLGGTIGGIGAILFLVSLLGLAGSLFGWIVVGIDRLWRGGRK